MFMNLILFIGGLLSNYKEKPDNIGEVKAIMYSMKPQSVFWTTNQKAIM